MATCKVSHYVAGSPFDQTVHCKMDGSNTNTEPLSIIKERSIGIWRVHKYIKEEKAEKTVQDAEEDEVNRALVPHID